MTELQPGPAGDARVAEWCEPKPTSIQPVGCIYGPVVSPDGWWICVEQEWRPNKQPTTNAAHAGEARRRADCSAVNNGSARSLCEVYVYDSHGSLQRYAGHCKYSETADAPDPKAAAEALATCRAIDAALKARERGE